MMSEKQKYIKKGNKTKDKNGQSTNTENFFSFFVLGISSFFLGYFPSLFFFLPFLYYYITLHLITPFCFLFSFSFSCPFYLTLFLTHCPARQCTGFVQTSANQQFPRHPQHWFLSVESNFRGLWAGGERN